VPTAIEDDDLSGGGKMWDVTLEVHLSLFPIRRCGQRDDPKYTRAHPLGDRLDRATLAGRIAPLKHDDDAQSFMLHPILQPAELDLKLAQLLFVDLALQFRFTSTGFGSDYLHDSPPDVARDENGSQSIEAGFSHSRLDGGD